MKYESSFPFYGLTRPTHNKSNGYKLYAIHVFFQKPTLDGGAIKKYVIMAVPNQPHYGFDTEDELEEFVFETFSDLQMFQEWAKPFKKFGSPLSIWQKQNLKPFKFS